MRAERLIPERDYQRGRTEAESARAALETLKSSLIRIEEEQSTRDRDRAAADAVVLRAANEIREGAVRVELTIYPDSNTRIAVEHGLPGSAEVAVEQITPLALLLRTAGVH